MREQRLKTDMSRANKELQYYQEKAEMAITLNKIEERRKAKLKKEAAEKNAPEEEEVSEGSEGDLEESMIKKKKMKNFQKMVKYH